MWFFLQYLSEVQHLNLGFNQMDSIPVPPVQVGAIKFKLTTLILRNNNLQNLKGKQINKITFSKKIIKILTGINEQPY